MKVEKLEIRILFKNLMNIEEYTTEIEEKQNRLNKFTDFITGRHFLPITVILVAIIAFSLGRISGLQDKRESVKVITSSSTFAKVSDGQVQTLDNSSTNLQNTAAASVSAGVVVASKNSDKYHYPWCSGAKRISPQNLVTYESVEAARAAGLIPAANCPGLK
ncbi:MAG: hypothetical protein JW740_01325 [Candidatus Zambryskibacteria bacterium]|nr:hypothetical protein [Candidatus Zambryskibacteria bacterium]